MAADTETFVLVHGAWHGGWCWSTVAELIRARGHRVTTPTMTGLGERRHLLSATVDLGLMITDIVNHIVYEDLEQVRLVGHSFGGPIITGVADRIPERLADLTYLDSLWLESGTALIDLLAPEVREARLAAAEAFDGGVSFPVPPPAAFGVEDPAGVERLARRLTPHPAASYMSPLRLENPPTNGLPARYVVCTDPVYGPTSPSAEVARAAGLEIVELAGPHDVMVTHPRATAEVLSG